MVIEIGSELAKAAVVMASLGMLSFVAWLVLR